MHLQVKRVPGAAHDASTTSGQASKSTPRVNGSYAAAPPCLSSGVWKGKVCRVKTAFITAVTRESEEWGVAMLMSLRNGNNGLSEMVMGVASVSLHFRTCPIDNLTIACKISSISWQHSACLRRTVKRFCVIVIFKLRHPGITMGFRTPCTSRALS